MQGKFIVFEGIDGCGKSTQLLKAVEYLFKKSKKNYLLVTREPTYRKYGMQIRELLHQQIDPLKDAEKFLELYYLDRKDHVENLILPNLRQESIVLCDRYMYSTFAYQQAQGNDLNKILKTHSEFPIPDLVLIFDLPAETAMQRMNKDGLRKNIESKFKNEKFEKPVFLEKARQNFLALPALLPKHNIKIIDSSKSIEEVWEKTKAGLDALFK